MKHIIIEGIDRMTKSTVIENLQKKLGHYIVIHYGKPLKSKIYDENLEKFQRESFKNGMMLLCASQAPLMFDRFSLGEYVYSPLYRGYDGSYTFEYEKKLGLTQKHVNDNIVLILLTTSNFSFLVDDGESHDFTKKEEEQERFIEAFNKTNLTNKIIIDVHNGKGFYKTEKEIIEEILSYKLI